jgi:hypothetical protein
MEHGDQVGARGLRGESGASSEHPTLSLFKNLGLKTGSAGSRVPFGSMDGVALRPSRSSVPKRSGLLLQFARNVPKMCPTSIDAKEFTEQIERREEPVCAGKMRRNPLESEEFRRINGCRWVDS